jgi:multiple sugar transport system substrate-binding protein
MNKLLSGVSAGVLLLACSVAAQAADLPGKFDGVTIDAKLIGGQQYEKLYERIGEWEKATGAKVNILSKKNHFELDKEIKSDIATGSTQLVRRLEPFVLRAAISGYLHRPDKLLPG